VTCVVSTRLQSPYELAVPYSTTELDGWSVVHLIVAENGPTELTLTPLTFGAVTLPEDVTTAVAAELADHEPDAFDAVTVTRSVAPTSADWTT
jgi:hypothetical protein